MVSERDLERAGGRIPVSSGKESGIGNLLVEEGFGKNRFALTCADRLSFYLIGMINKTIRLVVLGLVVGLSSAAFAGESCGSCHDDDGAAKKKGSETNSVTSPGKK